ncbi:MAG: diguanylate phosphodiesterase [Comamonadaceae bacterium SCN 68-20]|jgi:diguanylate cyclase (GGDEF)-like protein/PAS domain S-box-containing protein|nr:MAG: diguanylate phosphodiesterase [Comamonadaceae bacterium SCN 68-20]OJX16089.1 MAG: GGDEF domain-containing protein [Burkholderiales bacterium 68-20]UJB65976.1 EAL domain-containing protein [Acidovorax sp. YS12]
MPVSVLLIEGDAQHADAVVRALVGGPLGWRVDVAPSVAQARALLGQPDPPFDAVLVAHALADGSAFDALDGLPGLPSIIVLPPGQEEAAAQAMRRGFGDFVLRDADLGYLHQLPGQIEDLLVRTAAERARREVEAELDRTSALLAEKTRELEVTLASVSQAIIKVDGQGRIRVYNQRFLELLDLPEALLRDHPPLEAVVKFQAARGDFGPQMALVDAVGRSYVASECAAPAGERPPMPEMYLRRTPAGRYLEVRTRPVEEGGHVRTFTDVTDYVSIQEALRQSEARWRSLTQLSSDWYWEQDAEFRFVRFDGSPDRELGASDEELYGKRRWELPHAGVTQAQWAAHRAQLEAHAVFQDFEMQRVRSDGTVQWASISGEPIFDDQGQFTGYRGVARNITERKRAEAEIARLAFYDELTGLPNRRLLQDRLQQSMRQSVRDGKHSALLFLDLDNFKAINDSMGHDWGDHLLSQVSMRLSGCVRASDTVARLGGDEFVVVLQGLDGAPERAAAMAEVVAHKIIAALGQPYQLGGRTLYSTPSIGIALFQGQETPVSELLQHADLAMYQAKSRGRNTLCFFDASMQAAANARSALETDMRAGLQRDEFLLHYQRVVDAQGAVLGAEALVRWQHPQRGMVPPGEFIGVAEQTGLIVPLGQLVLRLACQQLACWARDDACAHWTLAVNVSAQEFRHPGFVQQVLDALAHAEVDPRQLKLELTESLLLHDVEECIAKMQALRAKGVRFALDDFGTGYSSLSYLKRLPLDQLKIDQGFVRDVLTDPNDAAIACTVIGLGRSLGLDVVAEGVETAAQRKFLLRNGCQRFQGYLFGRPAPAAALRD